MKYKPPAELVEFLKPYDRKIQKLALDLRSIVDQGVWAMLRKHLRRLQRSGDGLWLKPASERWHLPHCRL